MEKNKSDTLEQDAEQKIVIVGDSMIKHLNGYEMSKSLPFKGKVQVRSFSGAKTRCMKDYVKPTIREKPNQIVLHFGTNDLPLDREPNLIAKSIVDIASTVKNEIVSAEVTISSIILRDDVYKRKAEEVNKYLKEICIERNFRLLDHGDRFKSLHLNNSKLHLNKKGNILFSKSICKNIIEVFNDR